MKHFSHSNSISDSRKLTFKARSRRVVQREACMHFRRAWCTAIRGKFSQSQPSFAFFVFARVSRGGPRRFSSQRSPCSPQRW